MTHNPGLPEIVPCPACKADSVYVRSLDRYVHEDGSNNRPCWLACSRGETSSGPRAPRKETPCTPLHSPHPMHGPAALDAETEAPAPTRP